MGLYKISYVADFKITWNILSSLNRLKFPPRFLSNSSIIISFLSIVPRTISLINFLNLCLGNSIFSSLLYKTLYNIWIIITLGLYLIDVGEFWVRFFLGIILLGAVLLDRAREYFTVKNSIVSWAHF